MPAKTARNAIPIRIPATSNSNCSTDKFSGKAFSLLSFLFLENYSKRTLKIYVGEMKEFLRAAFRGFLFYSSIVLYSGKPFFPAVKAGAF